MANINGLTAQELKQFQDLATKANDKQVALLRRFLEKRGHDEFNKALH